MMDSVLRKMIREQLKEQESDHGEQNEAAGSSSSRDTTNKSNPSKKAKTETRLSGLLNKINRRNEKNESKKPKKVHIKWKRFCPIKNDFKLVRADHGGGIRLLEVPFCMDFSVEELMNMAISLYFAEVTGTNKYLETIEECIFAIVSPNSDELPGIIKCWPYVQENGLVISKSTFIFTSKSTQLSLLNDDFAFEVIVCENCNSTLFMTPFGNCLRCTNMLSAEKHTSPTMVQPQSELVLAQSQPTIVHGQPQSTNVQQAQPQSTIVQQAQPQPTIVQAQPQPIIVQAQMQSTLEQPQPQPTVVQPQLATVQHQSGATDDDPILINDDAKIVVKIHRATVMKDLMDCFKNTQVYITFYLFIFNNILF